MIGSWVVDVDSEHDGVRLHRRARAGYELDFGVADFYCLENDNVRV